MKNEISLAILSITVALAPYTGAFQVAVDEVKLPKLEAKNVEDITCLKRHNVKAALINAYKYTEAEVIAPFNYSLVRCKPHGTYKSAPMYFSSICNFEDRKWICEESDLHISVIINGRKVDIEPGLISPERAEQVLKKISTYGGFQGRSVDKGIGDRCRFSLTADPEEMELNCEDYIRISFWCPQPELTNCPRIVGLGPIYD